MAVKSKANNKKATENNTTKEIKNNQINNTLLPYVSGAYAKMENREKNGPQLFF